MKKNNLTETVLPILGLLFFAWLLFGGLLESDETKNEYTTRIDCSVEPARTYNKYCNGSYKDEYNESDIYNSGAYRGISY